MSRQLNVVPEGDAGSVVLFLANGRGWTVADAITAAHARGELDDAIEETLAYIAADDVEVDDDQLQKASERYRYEHDLISAGDTEEWLGARGLTVDDFAEWLQRKLGAESVRGLPAPATQIPDEFPDALCAHLWLSGRMEDLSNTLRRRVAAHLEVASAPTQDAAYEEIVKRVLSDDARRRKLATLRMPLTRIEVDSLDLESEAAAREAALCVKQDGLSLREIAADAGFHIERETKWVDDLDAKVSAQLSLAKEGEVAGPIAASDHFRIYEVVRRVEPAFDDAEVSTRIDEALLDEAFDELVARHTHTPTEAHSVR